MKIESSPAQMQQILLEQLLSDSLMQGADMAEKIIKLNAIQKIDVSQLEYMGNLVDMYV